MCNNIHNQSIEFYCNVQCARKNKQTKCKRYTNSLMSRDLLSDATRHTPYECNEHIHTSAQRDKDRDRKRGGAGRSERKKQCPFQSISYCWMTNNDKASPNSVYGIESNWLICINVHRTRHNSKQNWHDHLIKWLLLLPSMHSLSVNLKIVISRYEHM